MKGFGTHNAVSLCSIILSEEQTEVTTNKLYWNEESLKQCRMRIYVYTSSYPDPVYFTYVY
jgi:hypothetical protein